MAMTLVYPATKKAPLRGGTKRWDLNGVSPLVSPRNKRKQRPGRPRIMASLFSTNHEPSEMLNNLAPFLIHWAITAISLWVASHLFRGIKFESTGALVVSALLLGLANAVVKPLLIVLTLPLTLVTLGLFLLVINALMILLVAALVKGFRVSGFWTALFASIFISILSVVIGSFVTSDAPAEKVQMPQTGNWL